MAEITLEGFACKVRLLWNGHAVLEARCTRAMASDTVRDFLEGNFAGMDHKRWAQNAFAGLLDRLLEGECITLAYADATGNAGAEIIQ